MQGDTLKHVVSQLTDQLKPSLIDRLFFTGKKTDQLTQMMQKVMTGGAAKSADEKKLLRGFTDIFFARSMFFFYLLFLAYFIAIKIMDSEAMKEGILKTSRLDRKDKPWGNRYIRLVLYLLVFLVFVALLLWAFQQLIYFGFYAYVSTNSKPGENITPVVDELYDRHFFKFEASDVDGNLDYMFKFINYCIWGVFVMFIIYILFVRSFVSQTTYPDYTDDEVEMERSSERKFLVFYSLISLYAFLVFVTVFVSEWNWEIGFVKFLLPVLVIGLLSICASFVFFFDLKKQSSKLFISLFFLTLGVLITWRGLGS